MADVSKVDSNMFQSAPPTGVRGDPDTLLTFEKRTRVSIRSPHRSEGRCQPPIVYCFFLFVSIRSPHRSEGRCWLLQPAE